MALFICCSFLLLSFVFAWDGDEKGWVRPSLLVPSNISILPSWMLGVIVFLPNYPRGRVLGELSFWILKVLYNYLSFPS